MGWQLSRLSWVMLSAGFWSEGTVNVKSVQLSVWTCATLRGVGKLHAPKKLAWANTIQKSIKGNVPFLKENYLVWRVQQYSWRSWTHPECSFSALWLVGASPTASALLSPAPSRWLAQWRSLLHRTTKPDVKETPSGVTFSLSLQVVLWTQITTCLALYAVEIKGYVNKDLMEPSTEIYVKIDKISLKMLQRFLCKKKYN